jgi:hypothetical protein
MKLGYIFYGLGWTVIVLGAVLALDLFGAAQQASRLSERLQGKTGRRMYGKYWDKFNAPAMWRVWGISATVGFLVVVLVLWPQVIPL